MAQYPIQPKKQEFENSSGGEGQRRGGEAWRRWGRGVGKHFKKVGQEIQGSLHNIGNVRNPLQTMSHEQLFKKNGVLIVQGKSLKRLVKKFSFSKVAGQKPATLQKLSSMTGISEEPRLKFPEQFFAEHISVATS